MFALVQVLFFLKLFLCCDRLSCKVVYSVFVASVLWLTVVVCFDRFEQLRF